MWACGAAAMLLCPMSSSSAGERTAAPASRPASEAPAGRPATAPGVATVAVLPTQPMSLFFPVDDPALLPMCEDVLAEVAQADPRCRLIDRANLSRVLSERTLALMGYEPRPSGPIISADVFVLAQTKSLNGKSHLRVRAIHGATAGLLGEMTLEVTHGDIGELRRQLARAAAQWWPGVTDRLDAARSKAVWVVSDAQIASRELWELGEQTWAALHSGLAKQDEVFCITPSDLTDAQLEMFLKMIGQARPAVFPYTAAADYVLEARVASPTRIGLCIRDGRSMAMMKQTTVTGGNAPEAIAAAKQWALVQAARLAKPAPGGQPHASDARYQEWATRQARVEYEQGRLVRDECFRFRFPRTGKRPDESPEGKAIVEHYRTRYRRRFRRAAQLDPTWEEAAYQAAKSWEASFSPSWEDYRAKTIFHMFKTGSDVLWRFLRQFPRSPHHEEMLVRAYSDSSTLYRCAVRPAGLDERAFGKIKDFYLRRALECSLEFAERYELPGKAKFAKWGFAEHLLVIHWYLEARPRTAEELTWLVRQWAGRFDKHPDAAPHSDFVRLMVLAHKDDRKGFLKLLGELKTRWPDPKHPQWKYAGDVVVRTLSDRRWEGHSFQQWYMRRFNKDAGQTGGT